jgi:hypothetical protein
VKVELLRAAGSRVIEPAVPLLLESAKDGSPEVRQAALRSLRNTAGQEQVSPLVGLLVSAPGAAERREAEQSLLAALRRSEHPPVPELVSAYRAAPSADARGSLMMVMAVTGSNATLPLLREGLQASDTAMRRSAILALTEWPNAEPAPDLLAVARTDADEARKILALRGYIKLVGLPSDRPAAETASMAGTAIQLARQPDEKKAAIALLRGAASPEALAIAETAQQDPAVAAEASQAVEAIRRALGTQVQ